MKGIATFWLSSGKGATLATMRSKATSVMLLLIRYVPCCIAFLNASFVSSFGWPLKHLHCVLNHYMGGSHMLAMEKVAEGPERVRLKKQSLIGRSMSELDHCIYHMPGGYRCGIPEKIFLKKRNIADRVIL